MSGRVRRWLRDHPRVQAYVSRDEYEKVREMAEDLGVSVSHLVRRAVLDLGRLKEEVYERAFEEGFESGLKMGEEATMADIARGVFNVEDYGYAYPKCPYCGKPLTGVIADPKSPLGRWVLDKIREAGWHHKPCSKA